MSYHDDDLDETGPYFFEETPRQSPLNPYGAVPTQAKLQEEISKRNPSIRRFVNNSSNYQEDLGETGSSIYEEIVQTSDNMNEFHPRQRPVNPYRTAVTQDEIQEEIPKQRPPTRRFVNNSSKYHEDLVGTGSIFYDEILQTTDNMNGFHPRQKPVNPYKAVPTQAKLQDETPKQSTPTRRLVNQKELEFKSRIDTRKPLLSNIRAAISKVGNHFEIDTGKLAVVLKKYEENNNFDRHGYDVSFRYENEMIFFLLQAAVCSLARSVILVSPISDLGTVAPSSYQLALNFMINLQCRRTCEAPEKSKQDTTGTFSTNLTFTHVTMLFKGDLPFEKEKYVSTREFVRDLSDPLRTISRVIRAVLLQICAESKGLQLFALRHHDGTNSKKMSLRDLPHEVYGFIESIRNTK
ncbi:hypothetical protein B9Z55_008902 [Caenorhabditis nigoni]|uniref:Uncharacterized protein n=1 Tax=Caenorhabditis nigoni TaxID=1611254 RepID=A0A2G5UPS1_9PELO|nr:hypothetical protein B9Z55_008902 [Caenorhabditis nigoni]